MSNGACAIEPQTVIPDGIGQRLTLATFSQLAGTVAGYRYLKLVVDRAGSTLHFIDNAAGLLHVQYVGERILGMTRDQLAAELDAFNESVYLKENRRFLLATLAWHNGFFALETVEIDTMSGNDLRFLFHFVRAAIDPDIPLFLKPANHLQERFVAELTEEELPRRYAHQLHSATAYVPLNYGEAHGRLRVFPTVAAYRAAEPLTWYDIVVMPKVPEDIGRVSGMLATEHGSPLAHINVLAAGWRIPNAVRLDGVERFAGLDGRWVRYAVSPDVTDVVIEPAAEPDIIEDRPPWAGPVSVVTPDRDWDRIVPLDELRADQAHRYGTKAANLGELAQVRAHGSAKLIDYWKLPRPPRPDLLGHLANRLGSDDLPGAAYELLRRHLVVPRGIAVPFGNTDDLAITAALAQHLAGAGRVVVRSSANAEDLPGFPAAGLYESVEAEGPAAILTAVRRVRASLASPRAVRLRAELGIPAERVAMGVVIQEKAAGRLGGVLVTCDPLQHKDFRNVYANISTTSVTDVVSGDRIPVQHLYNTVEGGSRTVSLGSAGVDVTEGDQIMLARLALIGRMLQGHFAPPGNPDAPVDIEWVIDGDRINLVQIRPYQS